MCCIVTIKVELGELNLINMMFEDCFRYVDRLRNSLTSLKKAIHVLNFYK